MKVDDYGIVGMHQEEIVELLRANPDVNLENLYLIDGELYKEATRESELDLPQIKLWDDRKVGCTPQEYHRMLQFEWIMPDEYKNFDVSSWLLSLCVTDAQRIRVNTELSLYTKFNLMNLLRYLKFLRDIAEKNKIIWGVGRGSSCCSYCLYLMKIHRVDSLKFGLDIHEFLRN